MIQVLGRRVIPSRERIDKPRRTGLIGRGGAGGKDDHQSVRFARQELDRRIRACAERRSRLDGDRVDREGSDVGRALGRGQRVGGAARTTPLDDRILAEDGKRTLRA
ncbi:MAG: hypothetical protein ACYC9W_07570 [Candidatus Limnocylindria bacterium]